MSAHTTLMTPAGQVRVRVPAPELITAMTEYGAAYAWRCTGRGISRDGTTRLDAQVAWVAAIESGDEP